MRNRRDSTGDQHLTDTLAQQAEALELDVVDAAHATLRHDRHEHQ